MEQENYKSSNTNLYEFDNYRHLLLKLITERKKYGKPCSFRWLSYKAGLKSPNFFKMVIDGNRDLSSDLIEKTITIFGLKDSQARYFRNLVMFNKAKTSEEKIFYADKLSFFKKKLKSKKIHDLGSYYKNWYYVIIREYLTVKEAPQSTDKIAKFLNPQISVQEAIEALDELKQMNLIQKCENGKWQVNDVHLSSGDKISNAQLIKFHYKMLDLAKRSIDAFSSEIRFISTLSLSFSEEDYRVAIEKIKKLKNELLELSESTKKNSRIYQVQFQLFPVTEIIKE